VIEHSANLRGLIHVAAIRSTGLSASLAIGEHVVKMLAEQGLIAPGAIRPLPRAARVPRPEGQHEWWQRAARHHEGAGPQPLEMSGR
jgi:glycerol-3-phosphate dehydrogenase